MYQGDLARWLGTTPAGTAASNVRNLNRFGIEVTFIEGSLPYLRDLLRRQIPCIIFLRTGELPYWPLDTAHAVVLTGIDDEMAHLLDPAFQDAPKSVAVDALLLAWSGFDYAVASIVPTGWESQA